MKDPGYSHERTEAVALDLSTPRDMPVSGTTTRTEPGNRTRYPALDGIRAFAFTLVFLEHYFRIPWGWSGVNIFFVLSGFLITGILLDTRDDPHRIRNFYIRRTLRIFPLFYGVMLALVALYPLMRWQWSAWWLGWPLYVGNFLRFVDPSVAVRGSVLEHAADGWLIIGRFPRAGLYLGHLWSLCVEEQFYLAWPWVVFFVRSRKALLAVCLGAVVLCPVARILLLHTAQPWLLEREMLYRYTPLQLDSLLLGALLALLWRGAHRDLLLRAANVLAPLMLVFAFAYTVHRLGQFSLAGFQLYPYPSWKFALGLSYINILSAALVVCCLRPGRGSFYELLSPRPLRWIGRISYGAYVFHDIFHDLYVHLITAIARRHPMSNGAIMFYTAALAYPCTLLVAWLSFRYFEGPFLSLKERLTLRSL